MLPFRSAAATDWSGDKFHVGIAGVTLHSTRPIRIIEDTNKLDGAYSYSWCGTAAPLWRSRPPAKCDDDQGEDSSFKIQGVSEVGCRD